MPVSGDTDEIISANSFPTECSLPIFITKSFLSSDNIIFKKQSLQLDCQLEGHNQQALMDFFPLQTFPLLTLKP